MTTFEKFSAKYDGEEWPTIYVARSTSDSPPDEITLMIADGRERCVLGMTADGQMQFSEEFSASEQAKAFAQAINMLARFAVFPLAVTKTME